MALAAGGDRAPDLVRAVERAGSAAAVARAWGDGPQGRERGGSDGPGAAVLLRGPPKKIFFLFFRGRGCLHLITEIPVGYATASVSDSADLLGIPLPFRSGHSCLTGSRSCLRL